MDPFDLIDPGDLGGGPGGGGTGGWGWGGWEPGVEAPSSGGLWVSAADGWHDLAAVDVDGDGVADTGSWVTERGSAVFTDLDADGVADVCQQIHLDGTFETWAFDGDAWQLLDSGDL